MARSIPVSHEQTLPPELLRSVPRPTGLTRLGTAAVFFAVGIVVMAVAAAAWLYGLALRDARETTGQRRETAATVTRIQRIRGEGRRVRIEYSYAVGGRQYTARVKLRARDPVAAQARQGESILVGYLQSRPERSWLVGHEPPRPPPLWVGPLVALAAGIGAVAIWLGVRRQIRLLEQGRGACARVVETRKITDRQANATRVQYEWTLLSGARRRGHYQTPGKPPAVGAFIPIVYDPERPERRAVYPLRLVRVKDL
ncbi:MAG TPA: DUF3592 domain-containing protein [Bryobacteraceae bacterium]|nr:DUF3592 domain-containing protein [Bryobacteraceae bacterium]